MDFNYISKQDEEVIANIKKERYAILDKKILNETNSLRLEIRAFIDEVKGKLDNVDIDVPTTEEKKISYRRNTPYEVQLKVEVYKNYEDVGKWLGFLERSLESVNEENINNQNGYYMKSFFSTQFSEMANEIKWVNDVNNFKNHKIIDIPDNYSSLLSRIKEYNNVFFNRNKIIERESLKEFLSI